MHVGTLYEINGEWQKRILCRGGKYDHDLWHVDPEETEVNFVSEWGNNGKWNETFQVVHHYKAIDAFEQTSEGWAQVFEYLTTVREVKSADFGDNINDGLTFNFDPDGRKA